METYVIVSYYSDGSSKPDVDFITTADGAILVTSQKAQLKNVTIYKVTENGITLVTGEELRTVGENKKES